MELSEQSKEILRKKFPQLNYTDMQGAQKFLERYSNSNLNHITAEQAAEIMDNFFKEYPQVKELYEKEFNKGGDQSMDVE